MQSAQGQGNDRRSDDLSDPGQRHYAVRRRVPNLPRATGGRFGAGQALVEFAVVAGTLILIMVMGIQLSVIGNAALAVNQFAYSAARYASTHNSDPGLSSPLTDPGISALVPSEIAYSGSGTNPLSVSVNLGNCAWPTNAFGSPVVVTVSYNLEQGNRIFLPNPFLGVPITTTVSASQSAFCE